MNDLLEQYKNQNIPFLNYMYNGSKNSIPNEYFEYIKSYNGGYYFLSSLHLYGINRDFTYHDIYYMNDLISSAYQKLIKGLYFFAEDIFGNLFAFSLDNNIVFFNIETAEKEVIASGFTNWQETVIKEAAYYTGKQFVEEDVTLIEPLMHGKRYCPKLPFILEGKYIADNLVLKSFEENLKFSSDIAHQVYNTPDGEKFTIMINS